MAEEPNRWTPRVVNPDPRLVALLLIRSGLEYAERPRDDGLEAVLRVRIADAYRDGVRGPEDLAFRALEREGFAPAWKSLGEVAVIDLGTTAEPA